MHDSIQILRSVSILSFLFANIFMCMLFNHFTSNIHTLVYLFMFLVSLMILKTDYIIRKFELLEVQSKNENFEKADEEGRLKHSFSLLLKIMNVKSFLVLFKQIFFNTLYELFPVCIIWISILGLLFLANLLDFSISNSFYNVITVLGILLGVFQFYLQRQEEKIAAKIGTSAKRIGLIINEETNFEKFYNSLPEKPFGRIYLRNWISKIVIKPKSKTPTLFNLTYPDLNKKFDIIETAAETNIKKKEELIEAYKHFFDGEKTFNTIINRIYEEIDIKEFGVLALSSVNIFPEIQPQLTNSQLKNFIEKITDIEKKKKETINLDSSKKFRDNLQCRVMDEILSGILF